MGDTKPIFRECCASFDMARFRLLLSGFALRFLRAVHRAVLDQPLTAQRDARMRVVLLICSSGLAPKRTRLAILPT